MSDSAVEFPNLEKVQSTNITVKLTEADPETIKEVQTLLTTKGLYKGKVDGIVGELSLKAFAEFKESVWLDSPDLLGPTTAANLLEIAENHQTNEEQTQQLKVLPVSTINTKTGRTLRLVTGETVYENELVVTGIPLTWGEVTKGCDPQRNPESKTVINNIIKAAKGFGKIRDQYGIPIAITSAYRPPSVNRRIGGARYSQHINGLALDIAPSDGNFTKLLQICRASDCTGLGRGMHKGFIHCDWRPGGRVVFDY
ncbi:D-Ala-D-Ala carboxypeptidase family metallohydrolase [Nostoc sp. UHCC 0870]|uniref:D-Ala-D-Ala carboxypeptidase family metallohydrolase n=1 Tax=Nostoc sp. UHCC 0870 TaxID=2914041 RepID=UPI001EE02732|nr:D-Ala-D-Ala carboxypeptidase family metallohydrolase [Nostoc sp. UHCC 0870]UKO99493.1 D-Ala-D-Ala carboxypeptidase family metallohydrolase [Nostoc sp. UHCC 0870]